MEMSAENSLSDFHSDHLKLRLNIKNLTSTHLAKEVMIITGKKKKKEEGK